MKLRTYRRMKGQHCKSNKHTTTSMTAPGELGWTLKYEIKNHNARHLHVISMLKYITANSFTGLDCIYK
jgi:hypothetical protein